MKQLNKKPGTRYLEALQIGLTPSIALDLCEIKDAAKLRKEWDYRAHGLNITTARQALQKVMSRCSYHKTSKREYRPYEFCPNVRDYIKTKAERDNRRLGNLRLIADAPEAQNLASIKELTDGYYGHGYKCFVCLEKNRLLIKRHEDVTWSEKKSRHWPISRKTTIILTLISEAGDTITTTTLESRSGDWLQRAGVELGLEVSKRSAITQTGSMIPIKSYSKLCFRITELRLFGVGFPMYCAMLGDQHYHANTAHAAIRGLVHKLHARKQGVLHDDAVVTRGMCAKLGFCLIGTQEFLDEIGMGSCRSATAGEIREAIRDIDISPWKSELETLGIIPSPKPKLPPDPESVSQGLLVG